MTKELSEMTLEELWELFPIILEEHNPNYKKWYRSEKEVLEALLTVKRISHIGSSAVEGLLSKPTVDILLEVDLEEDMETVEKRLVKAGWTLMASQTEPYRSLSFNKGYTKDGFAEKVYHLHVRFIGDWDELYFRDYLMEQDVVANAYAQLKRNLIKKYKYNRDGYTDAKSEFIKKYTQLAREKYKNRYTPDGT